MSSGPVRFPPAVIRPKFTWLRGLMLSIRRAAQVQAASPVDVRDPSRARRLAETVAQHEGMRSLGSRLDLLVSR